MRDKNPDIVSASEIASWAWCPESWRLSSLGHEPGNRAAVRRGEERHALTALFERWSAVAFKLGVSLLATGFAMAALAFVLASCSRSP